MDEKLDVEDAALLSALEAGELDGDERTRAEALVMRSSAARAVVGRLKRLRAATAALPEPVLAPPTRRRVAEAVLAALAQGTRGRRSRRVAWFIAAALTAAAFVLALMHWRSPVLPTIDELRTGAGEHRLIQLGDRATAFVGENSIVRVDRGGPHATDAPLRVFAGRVRLVVKPDKDHLWTVTSDAADATVYGTEFDVDVSEGATEVRVARGEVELHNALGVRRLWAGEAARARVGTAPRRIEHIAPIVLDDGPAEIEERPPPRRKR